MSDNELQFIVYLVTCSVTGKAYVGQTKSRLAHRWAQHINTAKKRRRGSTYLHRAILQYGAHGFTVEEISRHATLGDANRSEREVIIARGTLAPNGFNIQEGENVEPRSLETRAKISAAHKGKISPLRGKPRPPHVIAAMSAAFKGVQKRGVGWNHSPETREKMRVSALNRGSHFNA